MRMLTLSIPHPSLTVNCQQCDRRDLQPLKDWLDVYLQGNYFFKEGHLANILGDAKCKVFAVLVDTAMAGVCIVYKDTTLHNLYLAPEYRRQGVGRALIEYFKPLVIRSKSDQVEGDPTDAYRRAGYEVAGYDPNRPHIRTMVPVAGQTSSMGGPPTVPTATAAPAHYQYQPGQMIPNHVPGNQADADAARMAKLAEKERKKKERLAMLREATKRAREQIKAAQAAAALPPQSVPVGAPPAHAPVIGADTRTPGVVPHPAAAKALDIWEGAD